MIQIGTGTAGEGGETVMRKMTGQEVSRDKELNLGLKQCSL